MYMIYPLNDFQARATFGTGGRQGRFELLGLAAKALPLAPAEGRVQGIDGWDAWLIGSGMGKLSTWVAS